MFMDLSRLSSLHWKTGKVRNVLECTNITTSLYLENLFQKGLKKYLSTRSRRKMSEKKYYLLAL